MENLSKNTQKEISRRELLKALAATTGAVAAASMLPSQWVSPMVEAGVLPAHAQGSTATATVVIRQTVTGYSFRVNGGSEKAAGTSVTFTGQTAGTRYLLEYRYVGAAGQGTRARFEVSINGGSFQEITAADPSNTDNSGAFAVYNTITLVRESDSSTLSVE